MEVAVKVKVEVVEEEVEVLEVQEEVWVDVKMAVKASAQVEAVEV